MLTVTKAARAYLAQLLAEAHVPDDTAFRIVFDDSDFGSTLGNARPDDTTVAHEGRTVLLLDVQVSQALADKMLDVQDTSDGPMLALR